MNEIPDRRRWESALEPLLGAQAEALWRRHCDAVNRALLERWLPERCADALKTDLYDEAMGDGLYPLLAARADRVAALDLAPSVLAAATARHPGVVAVLADARRLPFAAEAFDVLVSNSTLDHFATRGEILTSLADLHRVLRPGGRLLLTMDNLANPAVALRNALPFRMLLRLGLVAYPIGATGGPRRLRRMLREVGFEVRDTVALLHCPRAWSVARARRCERRGKSVERERFLRAALRWERLARWPTRFLTGYFVGIDARKRLTRAERAGNETAPTAMAARGGAARRSAYATGPVLRRALVTLRDEGLRSFWFKLLARCGYRRLLLLERPLDLPVPDFAPRLAVELSSLALDDVDDYRAFRPDAAAHDIVDRLRSGHLCFVARRDGRIVAGTWIAAEPVWSAFLGDWIDVAPGAAHIYDKYTHPDYRGQGIANAVRSFHLRHLQRLGFRRATGAVLPENVSSLRDDYRGGFRACGVLASIGIGPWRRVLVMRARAGSG